MLILRDYQIAVIERLRDKLQQHKQVLLNLATGGGKTALAVHMMDKASQQGKRAIFLVHQNELLNQTSKALWKQKLEHGLVASNRTLSKLPILVASVQTLVNRLPLIQEPDLIIIDEAHRSTASSYKRILEHWPNAYVIGLTATPQRTDGRGLDDIYQAMAQGPTIKQLINAGFLCEYELYAPAIEFNIDAVKTTAGDYNKADLETALDKSTITGDAVQHYKTLANGKRCVVMCATIKHATHVCERYVDAGINAVVIEGNMTNNEREKVLDDFKAGKIKVICNVQLLIEGVDIPAIEVVQWLRPTKSLIVWMQGNGRGLRPSEGKQRLIILDHVQNWSRHGAPCEDRDWTLEGREKGKRAKPKDPDDISIQQCKKCFNVFEKGVDKCPKCGSDVPKSERKLEEKAGELTRVEIEQAKKHKRMEVGRAQTIEELVKLGVEREMRKPAEWAAIMIATRQRRKPTPQDFNEARQCLGKLKVGA
jgi:superfamily II DNA or RNA helicase